MKIPAWLVPAKAVAIGTFHSAKYAGTRWGGKLWGYLVSEKKSAMKMPELLVFAKAFAIGALVAEVARVSFYAGQSLSQELSSIEEVLTLSSVLMAVGVCTIYIWRRDLPAAAAQLGRSQRIDLLLASGLGVASNALIEQWLRSMHKHVQATDPYVTAVILAMLLLLLISPVLRDFLSNLRKEPAQFYFLEDEEIRTEDQDVFSIESQAKSFADTILASRSHAGLVFGIDAPWGSGKTSFINLAERHWTKTEDNSVIVFRFEPLRYASEPNLAERFIRELSASIQKQVFVPEFRPVASRYSRMLKGKADLSFLGFKISLEPTSETIDELLEDIDDVLKRIGKRLIIVIDDLDRLEATAINSVLFTIRRTFKLSRATYILCYDTEKLIDGNTDREQAREFLEKFITVKLSLFVDSAAIRRFLDRDWSTEHASHLTVPSESIIQLASLLTELSNLLDGDNGASYMSLVGDLRKVKRFINAALFMRIGHADLNKTDFNPEDLINLILLHLNYPGIFRKIYTEETEGRSGIFGVQRNPTANQAKFVNSDAFADFLEKQATTPQFLLRRLFDVKEIELNDMQQVDEAELRSRACFNEARNRNLETYLQFIVRFVVPIPQKTFVLYRNAVDRVRRGDSVASVLESTQFQLRLVGEDPHDNFWKLLVQQSHGLARPSANDAIDSLVRYLPKYSVTGFGEGLRQRAIFSLSLLIDRTVWDQQNRKQSSSQSREVLDIAHRIFGQSIYRGRGLIRALASRDRGALGWNDLMLFRLLCSADRGGQLHNLSSALLLHQDPDASTTGDLSKLAQEGMRSLSQTVFALFKKEFIDSDINFLSIVDETPDDAFTGEGRATPQGDTEDARQSWLEDRIAGARTSIKAFVVYQLSNRKPPTGSGVGCGFYDETGNNDSGEIFRIMNDYIFGVCFNPQLRDENIYHFLDYCLGNLTSGFFTDEDGYVATEAGLLGGLDPGHMAVYWQTHRALILSSIPAAEDRRVVTANYVASYSDDLQSVIEVLDKLRASPLFH